MVKPPGFDPNKKYPLKFLIHGGPQGAWGNEWTYRWNAELFAAAGNYVVVMINFHGSTGYGQKFIDSISGDWGGAPYVDLMKGLDYMEKTYPFIDKNREAALGASYGGYMLVGFVLVIVCESVLQLLPALLFRRMRGVTVVQRNDGALLALFESPYWLERVESEQPDLRLDRLVAEGQTV